METGQEIPEENSYVETQQEEESILTEEPITTEDKTAKLNSEVNRAPFINGLAVGLGIGCITTFVTVWISLFFTPKLIEIHVTYENLLSIFVYPLIYLLAVGLIALTAGIVRQYYAVRNVQ